MILRPATPEEIQKQKAQAKRIEALEKIVRQNRPKRKVKPGRDPVTGDYNDLIAEPPLRPAKR